VDPRTGLNPWRRQKIASLPLPGIEPILFWKEYVKLNMFTL